MTLAAFWNGDWHDVCTQHDANSTDPAAWLRLAMAQHLLGGPAVDALAASLALGVTADEVRAADCSAAILMLAQSLLLSDMEPAALALIQQALPPWLDPAQRAPRSLLLACNLLELAGAPVHGLTLGGQGPPAAKTESPQQILDVIQQPHLPVALTTTQDDLLSVQPPEGVCHEVWTELLLNGITSSCSTPLALQLVESRSLPRSGHHYLRNLLKQVCGENFSYCEGYQEPGCCKSSPCRVSAYWHYARAHYLPHLRLLKSHDFGLSDSTFPAPPGMLRFVQVRKPVEFLISWLELQQLEVNRELLGSVGISLDRIYLYHEAQLLEDSWSLIDRDGVVMTPHQAQAWLTKKLGYVLAFLNKWLPLSRPFPFGERLSHGTFLLPYNDLRYSSQILESLGLAVPDHPPLTPFVARHIDVTARQSLRVSALVSSQLAELNEAEVQVLHQLPSLADGSLAIL